MSIVKKINDAYIASVKAKDEERRDTLKLVKAAFSNLDKAPGKEPSEADYMNALIKMAKTLKENAVSYPAMAETNLAEAAILEEFIPQALSFEDVQSLVNKTISELGLDLVKKNMGTIVKAVVAASNGATDGKTVSGIVSGLLV